jgi:hypothetical protein
VNAELEKLEQSKADLVACEAEISKAETEKAIAQAGIPAAPSSEKATELIKLVQATEALIVSYLRPKREKLTQAVTAAQAAVYQLSQQERMVVISEERLDNQSAIAVVDQQVRQMMLDLSAKVMTLASRYVLLKAQMQEISQLQAAGAVAPSTPEMPTVQTFDEITTELQKFGVLEWRPTIDFNKKMGTAPIYKSEVNNG